MTPRNANRLIFIATTVVAGMIIALTVTRDPILILVGGIAGPIAFLMVELLKRPCPSCGRRWIGGDTPVHCSCGWKGWI